MKSPTPSLWTARRGRRIGERGYVAAHPAYLPGTDRMLDHLSVCTLDDDEDCQEYTSSLWAMTEEGRVYAERIARDLLSFGYAWVWLHEADHVRVSVAPMHRLHTLGFVEADHV